MPFATSYLEDVGAVEIRYWGEVVAADGAPAIAATGELVASHGSRRFLADCSGLEVSTSLFDVLAFVQEIAALGTDAFERQAVILPQDPVAAERVEFFETAARNRGLNVRLFAGRDEAVAWLAG